MIFSCKQHMHTFFCISLAWKKLCEKFSLDLCQTGRPYLIG
uniref:Uncharacterized protein n=1 Tax=Arundo donax TaxID=35708 RepID=A0A0A9CIA6_ARUDO